MYTTLDQACQNIYFVAFLVIWLTSIALICKPFWLQVSHKWVHINVMVIRDMHASSERDEGMRCSLGWTVTWTGSAVRYYQDVLQLCVCVVFVDVCVWFGVGRLGVMVFLLCIGAAKLPRSMSRVGMHKCFCLVAKF